VTAERDAWLDRMSDALASRRAALGALGGGAVALATMPKPAMAAKPERRRRPFGGAYYVYAEAPYVPHLMTFNADGTMTSTNPHMVQAQVDVGAGDGKPYVVGTTDSLGMGMWRWDDDRHVLITMVQENAAQPSRTRAPRLHVTARVRVGEGGSFAGPAIAELLDMDGDGARVLGVVEAVRSHLMGWRLAERVSQLSRDDRKYLYGVG